MKDEITRLSIDVTKAFHKKMKLRCIKEAVTLRKLVVDILEKFFKSEKDAS